MGSCAGDESDDDVLRSEISDEALEAAACAERMAAYTQIAYCTMGVCPGG